jgi:quercetin dioxygenase-like cupin family protein
MSRSFVPALATVACLSAALAPSADAPLGSKAVTWEEIQERPSPNGRSRSILRGPTATLDELESHVTVLPAGQASHAPHRHPEEEVIIIREGTLDAYQNGATHRIGPGSVLFMASGEEHNVTNVGDTPAVYFVVMWKSHGAAGAPVAP